MSETDAPVKPTTTNAANVRLQLWTLVVHATIVFVVVVATTALAWARVLTADAIVGLFGTALGFSGAAAAYGRGVRNANAERDR